MDELKECVIIVFLCLIAFLGGVHYKAHQYRQACGDILVSYTEGYNDCREGK